MRIVISYIILLFAVLLGLGFNDPAIKEEKDEVDKVYTSQIDEVLKSISLLENACADKASAKSLKKIFRQLRIDYKKPSVLIEYFHPFESRSVNGPVIRRVEDDNPESIIEPKGLQVLEQLIYEDWNKEHYQLISDQVARIKTFLAQLKNQPDRSYPFKNELVFTAIKSSLIKITALDITGFDSPIAKNSLYEAAAVLESIQAYLLIYLKGEADKQQLVSIINNALWLLRNENDFNGFDRAEFITNSINPLFNFVQQKQIALGYLLPNEKRPINQQANGMFASDFFDLNFFSPSEKYRSTPDRILLGKKLFFDPILSATRNRSCASCHKPELAFTDGLKTAMSVDQKTFLKRNTPTLWNSVYQTKQFYDGRAAVLEHQLNDVVHNQAEMKGSLSQSVKDLSADKEYAELFKNAYANESPAISQYNIANAISNYVRSLVSLNSRFDQYMRGNSSALNKEEIKGFNLFTGKAKCATCHFLPLFNGLVPPEYSDTESEVLGVPKSINKTNAELDDDLGRFNFTKAVIHKHAFKTPTLRNIELTAPYMHNGVFKTLEEVMEFYNNAGGAGLNIAPENQTLEAKKLKLSKKEIKAVVAFMKSLTDSTGFNK